MRHMATRSPSSSCKKIRVPLLAKGANSSLMIVLQRLSNEFRLKSNTPAGMPRLTTAMNLKRLNFAKKYVNWAVELCGKVLISVELLIKKIA